jgi:hypothetical protein
MAQRDAPSLARRRLRGPQLPAGPRLRRHAALDLTHVSADVREATEIDGVVGPGDQILVDETFRSATPVSGVKGQLFTPDGDVEVGEADFRRSARTRRAPA